MTARTVSVVSDRSYDTDSFFHRIQSLFSADFHGRYLALLLVEVGRKHPDCLVDFFSHATGIPKRRFQSPRFEVEYAFRGKAGNNRRADIAVFLAQEDQEPSTLVEIKYFDKPRQGDGTKAPQLDDYAAWIESETDRHFVAICREKLEVPAGKATRWGDLAKRLRSYAGKSELVQLLVDYLEREGITLQAIEPKPLLNFFKSMLCSPWGSGVLANNLNGPVEFGKLQMNLKYAAGAFDPVFKSAWREAGEKADGEDYARTSRTATVAFELLQCLKSTDSEKLFDGTDNYLRSSQKDGGVVSVYAQYSLGHGQSDWLRVSFGLNFEVESDSDFESGPSTRVFAEVQGNKLKGMDSRLRYKAKVIRYQDVTANAQDSLDRVERTAGVLLHHVLTNLADQKLPLTKQQKLAVARLIKALSAMGAANGG